MLRLIESSKSITPQSDSYSPQRPTTILGTLANTGANAVHAASSVLDVVPRVLYGSLNAASDYANKRPVNFGNFNPIDNTNGIQASDFLTNRGLLTANDPNKWELRDALAFGLDIAGDPQTWIPGANIFSIGKHVAKGVGKLGGKAIAKTLGPKPAQALDFVKRNLSAQFDRTMAGKTAAEIQKHIPNFVRGVDEFEPQLETLTNRLAYNQGSLTDDQLRSVLETPGSSYIDAPEVSELLADNLVADRIHATGSRTKKNTQRSLHDVHKNGETAYFPRELTKSVLDAKGRVKQPDFLKGRSSHDQARDPLWMGWDNGSTAINNFWRDPEVHRVLDLPILNEKQHKKELLNLITTKYGGIIDDLYPNTAGSKSYDNLVASAALAGKKAPKPNRSQSRYKNLSEYLYDNRNMRELREGMFTNNPIADLKSALLSKRKQHLASPVVFNVLTDVLRANPIAAMTTPGGETVEAFLQKSKYAQTDGLNILAKNLGVSADVIKTMSIPDDIAKQLHQITPGYKAPPADVALKQNIFQRILRLDKAATLAFPASRFTDAAGGLMQNILNKQFDITDNLDADKLLRGQNLSQDFGNIPAVKDWLQKTGRPDTKENQAEALRQLVGSYFPTEMSYIGGENAPPVQTLQELTKNVPSRIPRTALEHYVSEPVSTFFGKGAPNSSGMVPDWTPSSFFNGIRGNKDWNTGKLIADTKSAPIAASEMIGGRSDLHNRTSAFLTRIKRGEDLGSAANAVNSSQVDYSKLTPTEKVLRDNLIPFYGFQQGILKHTAKQFADPLSYTSLLSRMNNREPDNPDIPDRFKDELSIPLENSKSGAIRKLTNLRLMHESPLQDIGNTLGFGANLAAAAGNTAAGLYNSARGNADAADSYNYNAQNNVSSASANLQKFGYDRISSLNSIYESLLKNTYRKSAFKDGESIDDERSLTGDLLRNLDNRLAPITGRPQSLEGYQAPVNYGALQQVIDPILSSSMGASRLIKTLTQLTENASPENTDKEDLLLKALRLGTGYRRSEFTKQQQLKARRKKILGEINRIPEVSTLEKPFVKKEEIPKMNPLQRQKWNLLHKLLNETTKSLKEKNE